MIGAWTVTLCSVGFLLAIIVAPLLHKQDVQFACLHPMRIQAQPCGDR